MRTSKIKAKLARNEPALCTSLSLADPAIFELTSLMGFDGIWMDLEHHTASLETAAHLMRAARVGSADIVARPAKGEFMRMSRMLEIGAQGIMYPRCDNAAEAAEVVRWAKFAPDGMRGFDGGNADAAYTSMSLSDYVAHANRETFIIIQLEHPQAIEQADAIAAVPGVDALMVGPADFSILGGFPGEFDHPQMTAALDKTARAARQTGKHWAFLAQNAELADHALKMGAALIFHFSDLVAVKNALERVQQQFSPMGFTFDDCRNGKAANEYAGTDAAPRFSKPPMFIRGNMANQEQCS
ncbi:MAG: aldolase [Pirellulales bacterium]|nr:aldolase [Pirellulales bacterium]